MDTEDRPSFAADIGHGPVRRRNIGELVASVAVARNCGGLSRRITAERAKRRAESGAMRNWKVSGIGRTDLGSEMCGTYM
jgi:hypothetical protein